MTSFTVASDRRACILMGNFVPLLLDGGTGTTEAELGAAVLTGVLGVAPDGVQDGAADAKAWRWVFRSSASAVAASIRLLSSIKFIASSYCVVLVLWRVEKFYFVPRKACQSEVPPKKAETAGRCCVHAVFSLLNPRDTYITELERENGKTESKTASEGDAFHTIFL